MSYQFSKEGGGEQSYGIIGGCPIDEMTGMLAWAKSDGIDMVAIMDAECDVVMITTKTIAEMLLPILNSKKHPLEGLNYIDNKVPEDVLEGRRLRGEE